MGTAGCTTCRHKIPTPGLSGRAEYWKCGAVGGEYASTAFRACKGSLWESKPPGLFARVGDLITSWARIGDAIADRVRGRKPS